MKKTFRLLSLLLISVMGLGFASCSDDDDEVIAGSELPSEAKAFVSEYFPSASIVSARKDKNEYEVTLSEGTRIEFDKKGVWQDVDAALGKTVPSGFYPASIDEYISATTEGIGINEISKEKRGYDVELTGGIEMLFDYDGQFISYGID